MLKTIFSLSKIALRHYQNGGNKKTAQGAVFL
jgi:hypothetical protein